MENAISEVLSLVYYLNSNIKKIFCSIKECSVSLGIKYSRLAMILTGRNSDKRLRKLGYTVKFEEITN